MANNFKPWVDTPTPGQQVQSPSEFESDEQRINGFKAGDPASALRVNSALRQANVVIAGLMEFCDEVKTLPNDLSLLSTVNEVKNAIKDAFDELHNITLANAKEYADTRETTINTQISNVQTQVTGNKNDIITLVERVDEHDDELADLKPVAFSGNYNDLLNKPNPVLLTGNQTINGIKTFSNSPVVPTPTNDNHAANFGLFRLSAQYTNITGFIDEPPNDPNGVVRGQFSLSNWTDPNKPFIVVTCFAMGSGLISAWGTYSFTPMILVRCGNYYEGSGAISYYYSSSSSSVPITARISIKASDGSVTVRAQRPLEFSGTGEAYYQSITFIGMTGLYI